MGYGATIAEILDKFDSCYGNVDSKEHLLAKFYSSKQEEHEDVTKWSSRLEDILASAVERKLVPTDQVNDMLRNMFFQGLKPSLKDICAYKFEQIKEFDSLRVAIRKIEQEHIPTEQVTHCHASVNQKQNKKEDKSELKEMKTMIQSLTNTVQQLENKFNSSQMMQGQAQQGFNQRGRGKKNRGRGSNQGFYGNQNPSYQNNNQGGYQRSRSRGRGQYNNQGQGQRFNNQNQGQGQGFNYQGQAQGFNQQYQGPRFNNPSYANQNQGM